MHHETVHVGEVLSAEATRSLLTSLGHGVLSLAQGDRAYGVPVSFGYDDTYDRCVFELLNDADSRKRRFVERTAEGTLTAYRYEAPDRWESAIVTGPINPVDARTLPERSVWAFVDQGNDAAEAVRWKGAADLQREWYELRPRRIDGRRAE